jgi:hypothetical protein
MRPSWTALSAVAIACAPLATESVPGWPLLEIVEHHVPYEEMSGRCARYVGFGALPLGCAEFDLEARVCHVWVSTGLPGWRVVRDHERRHCAGYDHAGASNLRRVLENHAIDRTP